MPVTLLQSPARGRLALTVLTFVLYTTMVVVFVNAEAPSPPQEGIIANANAQQQQAKLKDDVCEERIRKEVWETFTSQIDSVHASLEESNQRVHAAEHAHKETERTLSLVQEQSATCKESLKESDTQENFLANTILKWKTRYEQSQKRFYSVEHERNELQESVQSLKAQLASARDDKLQQEQVTVEKVQAAGLEVPAVVTKRLEHFQGRNKKLTAERQELTDELKRYKDHLQFTKDRLFGVRQELFRANTKIRETEKQQNAFRDFLWSWYEMIKPGVDALIKRVQPYYELAVVPIGRGLSDKCNDLANQFLHLVAGLWSIFFNSCWPLICQFVTAAMATIARLRALCARALTESAPFRASAWAKIDQVGTPLTTHASIVYGQLVEGLGSLQKILVHRVWLSSDTLLAYLLLQEGPARLVSATRFIKEHSEASVVYVEGTLATFLMALALWLLLSWHASTKPVLRSTNKSKSTAGTKSKVTRFDKAFGKKLT
jgi:hypothetical protein